MSEKPYRVWPRKFFGYAVHVGPPGTPVVLTAGGYTVGTIEAGKHFYTPGVIWTTPEGIQDLERGYVIDSAMIAGVPPAPALESIEPGSIVLVSPRFINPAFRGCCAVVEQCATWGVNAIATGPAPTRNEEGPLAYPLRLLWADVEPTGGRLPPGWRFGDDEADNDD